MARKRYRHLPQILIRPNEPFDFEAWLNEYMATEGMAWLLPLMKRHFDEEEFKTLCFQLGIDYNELDGRTKTGRMRELILLMHRENRLSSLVDAAQELRPTVKIKPKLVRAATHGKVLMSRPKRHRQPKKISDEEE